LFIVLSFQICIFIIMKKVMYPIFAIAIITQSDSVLGSIKHVPPDSSALIGRMWTKETPPPIPGAISGNFASAPMAAVFDTVVVYPSQNTVPPNGEVWFKGSGFKPGEGIIIYKDKKKAGRIRADAYGSFQTQNMPVGEEAGLDIFVFRGEKSKLEHRVTVEISSFLE